MHVHARVVPLSSHMLLLLLLLLLMHHLLTLVGVRVIHRVRLTLWDHMRLVGVLVAGTSEFTGILQDGSLVRRRRSNLYLCRSRWCKVARGDRSSVGGVTKRRISTIRWRSECPKRIASREMRLMLFVWVSRCKVRLLTRVIRLRWVRIVRVVCHGRRRARGDKHDGLSGSDLVE